MQTLTAILVSLLAAPAADSSGCGPVVAAVNAVDRQATAGAVLDATADCADVLAPLLATHDETRQLAAYALALMGEPRAQDLLYESVKRRPDPRIKVLAAAGAAAVGRPVDVQFLCGALDGETLGPRWFGIEAAALSLTLLRSADCRDTLERVARSTGRAGLAARHALRTAAAPPPCRSTTSPSAAVLACAVPRTEEAVAFYQAAGAVVWQYSNGRWSSRAAQPGEENGLPRLRLSETISADGRRALVRVGLVFGLVDGSGYLYRAVRHGAEWQVVMALRTWIS